MTDSDRERMYKACCAICTLAEAMKNCKLCQFNIGLKEPKKEEIKGDGD